MSWVSAFITFDLLTIRPCKQLPLAHTAIASSIWRIFPQTVNKNNLPLTSDDFVSYSATVKGKVTKFAGRKLLCPIKPQPSFPIVHSPLWAFHNTHTSCIHLCLFQIVSLYFLGIFSSILSMDREYFYKLIGTAFKLALTYIYFCK